MPRLRKLEIAGFRSFGEPCELEFSGPCSVITGANSQGKTSIAEALEFLFTGSTVRRELIGGAKAEFSGSLRNVYRPVESDVWVQATIEADDGNPHVVRRVLETDYSAQEDCVSTLTVDGATRDDLSELGIHLATAPLRAPVLLQHSLRFALSAKPSDRSEYFKAVVSVSDLERFRNAVSELEVSEPDLLEPPLRLLAACEGHVELEELCEALAMVTDRAALDEQLRVAIGRALVSAGEPENDLPDQLQERRTRLRQLVAEIRDQHFVIADLAAPDIDRQVSDLAFDVDLLSEFIDARNSVDVEVIRTERIFKAVLEVPAIGHAHEPRDCPVCETRDALSPARIKVMREQVEGNSRLGELRTDANRLMESTKLWLESQELRLGGDVPTASGWNEARWAEVKNELEPFGVDGESIDGLREPLEEARETIGAARKSREDAFSMLAANPNFLDDVSTVRARELAEALALVEASRSEAVGKTKILMENLEPISEQIARSIDRAEGFAPWADLLNLVDASVGLYDALRQRRARREIREELRTAVADIDAAKGLILDRRFEEISSDIEEWWELLRPEEHVRFGGVRRRGTGRRFVDFKARLHVEIGGDHFERDAIGVLSDSQMNALGLAAFLARCQRQGSPIVVLDEPVQAGDNEHRITFARFAIERLIGAGIQLVVCSFDRQLVRVIGDLYRDLPVDIFSVSLGDRTRGTEVVKTSNPILTALLDAKSFSRHDDEAIRAEGTRKMRPAAEALAKEIILRGRRANGDTCDLSEYDEMVLGELFPILEPYLLGNEERGKWRAAKTVLNPGHHDDEVPARTALMTTVGDLIKSQSDHELA